MQNAAGTRNTEEGFKVARVVPHHRGDAVTGFQAQFRESGREAARPAIEFAVARANDGLVRLARDDFDARKDLRGALQDGGQRQGKIHHGAAHKAPWQEIRLSESYHQLERMGKSVKGSLGGPSPSVGRTISG